MISYQIRLSKPFYKNRPNLCMPRIYGYADKGGLGTGFGIRAVAEILDAESS